MNPPAFRRVAICIAAVILSGCGKKPETASPPAAIPEVVPVPVRPTAEELAERQAELERRAAQVAVDEARVRREAAEARLAAAEEALENERRLVERERALWLRETTPEAPPFEGAPADAAAAVQPSGPESAVVDAGWQAPFDYGYFHEALTPWGQWLESDDFGYVWQPQAALTSGWRPYTLGRWARTDGGWTWCSDEPFGWACYHYGRWALTKRCGWVWVPGDVWAPAWVAWRSSGSHIGWCPLPPETLCLRSGTWNGSVAREWGLATECWCFVPARSFDQVVHRFCEPPSQNRLRCAESREATRLVIAGGRVVCDGPDPQWVNRCLRRPMEVCRLVCEGGKREGDARRERIESGRLICHAPVVRAPWNAQQRPSGHVAGVKVAAGDVVRGPGGLPGKLAARYREQRRTELELARKAMAAPGAARLAERRERVDRMEREIVALRASAAPARATTESRIATRPEVPAAGAETPGAVLDRTPAKGRAIPAEAVSGVPSVAVPERQAERTNRPDELRGASTLEVASATRRQEAEAEQRRLTARAQAEEAAAATAERERLVIETRRRELMERAPGSDAQPSAAPAPDVTQSSEARRMVEEQAQRQATEQGQREVAEHQRETMEHARAEQAERSQREQVERQREAMEQARAEQAERTQREVAERQREIKERARAEQAERAQREQMERQRRVMEQARAEQAERGQREAMERARAEQAERAQREQMERQRRVIEQARAEQVERAQREQVERQRQAMERARAEQAERAQREQVERQREAMERARAEQAERAQREQVERQRQAMERARAEQAERAQREQVERQREAMERARAEQAERAQREQVERQREAMERARAEQAERAQREQVERQREVIERARAEQAERAQREQAERGRGRDR